MSFPPIETDPKRPAAAPAVPRSAKIGEAEPESIGHHLRRLLVLGLPLIGSNLAQIGLHVADTVMMGWYGVAELGAIVLASGMFFVLFLLGSGFSYALMGRVSAALGAGDETQVRRDTRMTLWLSAGFGVLLMPILWHMEWLMLRLGQTAEIAALAGAFMKIAMLGMVPALIVAVVKAYLSAFERTQAVMVVTVLGVGLNVVMNWGLIFGNFGLPELGIRGAAISSVTVQVVTAALLLGYSVWLPDLRRFHLFQRFWRPDWEAMVAVARMGVPIGLTALAETGMFQATALMMGWLGPVALAAHGIALELASITFMVHMAVSNAATVRAGRAWGRGDRAALRRGAAVAQGLSLCFAACAISAFLLIPEHLVGLFLDRSDTRAAQIMLEGVTLLAVAGLFQTFDSTQVMALGLLRGVQDTRVPMWVAATSYWLVGVPCGYVMAFPFGFGAVGLWLGLVVGLACVGVTLILRFWRGPWMQPHPAG